MASDMACETCAPAAYLTDLAAQLRLMEASYHADMNDIFARLDQLETRWITACRSSPESPPRPAITFPRQRTAHHLQCSTCQAFVVADDYFSCSDQQPTFPGLCEQYTYAHQTDCQQWRDALNYLALNE